MLREQEGSTFLNQDAVRSGVVKIENVTSENRPEAPAANYDVIEDRYRVFHVTDSVQQRDGRCVLRP